MVACDPETTQALLAALVLLASEILDQLRRARSRTDGQGTP